MKKFFSRFLKQDRGVVMMEYVVLGVFTVAVTVVAAMALGIAYTSELNVMTQATVGNTSCAEEYNNKAKTYANSYTLSAEQYLSDLTTQNGYAGNPVYGIYK